MQPNIKKQFLLTNLLVIIFLLATILISLRLGTLNIGFVKIFHIMINSLIGDSENSPNELILLKIRLPRILIALLIGGTLSVSGLVFQTVTRNPLADPYILGISSGASLGAVLSILLESVIFKDYFPFLQKIIITPLVSFIFGMGSLLLVLFIARERKKTNIYILLLAGVITSFFTSSITMFILMVFDKVRVFLSLSWILGNLSNCSYIDVLILFLISIIGTVIIFLYAKELNILSIGEDVAITMGIDTQRVILLLLFTLALMVSVSVSIGGCIGFVGLMIPHGTRLIFGSDNRLLVPLTFWIGGSFLIISDTIARTLIAPSEIPVGIVTSFFGAPFFLWILIRTKDRYV